MIYQWDRHFFLQIENFLPPDDSETSDPEESTGKNFFENSNFLLLKNLDFYIFGQHYKNIIKKFKRRFL